MSYTSTDSGLYEVAGPTLTEIIRAIISVDDPGEVVATAVSRCGAVVRAEGAMVLVRDASGALLMGSGAKGVARPDVRAVQLDASTGIAGAVATTREPALVADVREDARFDPTVDAPHGTAPRSVVAVPLLAHGQVLGVLLAVRGADRRPFTTVELSLLETVAPHVAIAVSNAFTLKALREARAAASVTQADLEAKVQQRTTLLVKAKREWETTVDAISEPLALIRDLTVTRANVSYGRRAQAQIREVPGKKCYQLLARRATPCPGCPVVAGAAQAEVRMGAHRFEVSTFSTGEEDGSVVVHYRDVTEQRQLEERLRQTERMASLGQLASGAAHEINNPLGFVLSNLRSVGAVLEELRAARDVASFSAVAGELRESVADAVKGAERVAAIVRGLRNMSRQQVGEVEPTSLADSVRRAVASVFSAPDQGVRLELLTPVQVRAVPLMLDQALAHILQNARQAVQRAQGVSVAIGSSNGEGWVKVHDDGVGIAPAHLQRIFEPFFSTRGVGGGVGLGLTAAWSIVQSFGGRIEVESTEGKGSTFTVRLPLAERPPERAAVDEAQALHAPA